MNVTSDTGPPSPIHLTSLEMSISSEVECVGLPDPLQTRTKQDEKVTDSTLIYYWVYM